MKLTESQIQTQIINYLQHRKDLFFQRTNNICAPNGRGGFKSLSKGQKKGFPDILVLKHGKCIGIEVKTVIGSQSKYQKEMEKEFIKNGGEYFIVRSLEDVIEVLG